MNSYQFDSDSDKKIQRFAVERIPCPKQLDPQIKASTKIIQKNLRILTGKKHRQIQLQRLRKV